MCNPRAVFVERDGWYDLIARGSPLLPKCKVRSSQMIRYFEIEKTIDGKVVRRFNRPCGLHCFRALVGDARNVISADRGKKRPSVRKLVCINKKWHSEVQSANGRCTTSPSKLHRLRLGQVNGQFQAGHSLDGARLKLAELGTCLTRVSLICLHSRCLPADFLGILI